MAYNYRIQYSEHATQDLTHIYVTGTAQWGRNAADLYLQHLVLQCGLLASQPHLGRQRNEILYNLRSLVVKQHIIFYQITDQSIQIIRILNAREDVDQHLP